MNERGDTEHGGDNPQRPIQPRGDKHGLASRLATAMLRADPLGSWRVRYRPDPSEGGCERL